MLSTIFYKCTDIALTSAARLCTNLFREELLIMAMYYNDNNKKKPKQSSNTEKKYPIGLLLPVIAILAVIPLVTFLHQYNTNLTQFDWYTSVSDGIDFFLYNKMICFIIACCCMIFCLIYMIVAEEQKAVWIKNLIPLAIYCVLTFISALASKYKYFSLHGIHEQFYPVWALMGYCLVVYYCFFVFRTENAVRRTMKWFVAGITVMTLLGLSQTFNHDFFQSSLGQKLITPSSYKGGPLAFNFEPGRPYLSVYNPNYVGFYVALVVPVLVALIFTSKILWHRIGYGLLIVSLLLILFASQSRAGIIALIFAFLVMLLCMRKVFIKNWKITVAAIGVFIIAFIVINVMNQNILIDRMKSMFTTKQEEHPLESIITGDDAVTITYNGEKLAFSVTQNENGDDVFTLTDGNGKNIGYKLNDEKTEYAVDDDRFPFTFVSVRADSLNGFVVYINGDKTVPWYFTNLMKKNDSSYYVVGGSGAMFKLTRQEKSIPFLENHYHFANMRGYIWSRTIPLLKKYFFLGSGPDTFVIAYPNNDLVGAYNSGHQGELITKPHCMLLQIAVQTGVPSLIAFLVFIIWYLISSLRLYWNMNYEEYLPKIGVAIFVAAIAYLILALTNDSCIATSPIFYALLGMGLGINYKLKKDKKETVKPKTAA